VIPGNAARRNLLAIGLLALCVACGKKGPPQPPVRVMPPAPGPVHARQVGRDIWLTADVPNKRTDGSPLSPNAVLRVLRLRPPENLRPGVVSDRYLVQQFEKQATEIAALTGVTLEPIRTEGHLHFIDHDPAPPTPPAAAAPAGAPSPAPAAPSAPAPADAVPPSSVPPAAPSVQAAVPRPAGHASIRLLYGLQTVDGKQSRSPIRPPIYLEWVTPPAVPHEVRAEVAEGEVRLSWTSVPPARAGSPSRYEVYRREASAARDPDTPLNAKPLEEPKYVDGSFRYDVDYLYTVRTVLDAPTGRCESDADPPVAVRPHDVFAPMAPSGLAVAAEGGVIKVYWFPNAEPDLAGYRIYRRAEGEAEATRIGEVGATETSFVDNGASTGVRYHYAVTAIDSATPVNESPRSEERSERLTPESAPGAAPGTKPDHPRQRSA
jgi:hypothetical protein